MKQYAAVLRKVQSGLGQSPRTNCPSGLHRAKAVTRVFGGTHLGGLVNPQ